MNNDEDLNFQLLEKISFILKGENRLKIYISLLEDYKTASELSKDLNISLTSICRSLKDLENENIIFGISYYNSRNRGKLYTIIKDEDFSVLKNYIIKKVSKKDSE